MIDLVPEMYGDWLHRAIRANASYRGYPIAAPIAKQLIAKRLADRMLLHPSGAVVEGSSGLGNDQFRLRTPLQLFAPEVRVITPIRELNLTRREECLLAEHFGLPMDDESALPGGDDLTAWCRSLGSGAIALDAELPAGVWRWWRDPASNQSDCPEPVTTELGFERGVPVTLDGARMPLAEMAERLNPLAGSYGIGRVDILEDGVTGLKSRELYEAPAATLILAAHRELEHLCISSEELRFKAGVDARWLELVYGGHAFHPLIEALDAFIDRTQQVVTGRVAVLLHRGGFRVAVRSSPESLFNPLLRGIYGSTLDQRPMAGAVIAHGLPYRALRSRRDRRGPVA